MMLYLLFHSNDLNESYILRVILSVIFASESLDLTVSTELSSLCVSAVYIWWR